MFSAEELAAFSDADRAILKDMNQFKNLHKDAALGQMEALAVEHVARLPSLLFSRDNADRLARRRVAIDDERIARLIGPSVARSITQLDVGAGPFPWPRLLQLARGILHLPERGAVPQSDASGTGKATSRLC